MQAPAAGSTGTTVRGRIGTSEVAQELAVVVEVLGPRYSFRLPTVWKNTKPMSMMPVMAITYFLPTADR